MSKKVPFSFDDVQALSPQYYGPSHRALQQRVRAFVSKEIDPYVEEWEEQCRIPNELHRKAAAAGIYALGYPCELGGSILPCGTAVDMLHVLVMMQEFSRCGAGGVVASLFSFGIGLPPLIHLGPEALRQRVAPEVLRGEKIMCLCITEPFGGSDVARLRTSAKRSADGTHFLVTGEKMFITSGMRADYFTVAVRTEKGITLMLLERTMPGITLKSQDKKMGWWASDTAMVIMEDVRVPVGNIIGTEGKGFLGIMLNFNSERLSMAAQATAFARVCLEESIEYARSRQTFGKPLITNQVIRHKIIDMATRVVTSQNLVEALYYRMGEKTSKSNPPGSLSTEICLAKLHCVQAMEYCAREACQVFGGRSYLRGGRAGKVERIYREVRVMAIGGGSEEIMRDLAARQAKL